MNEQKYQAGKKTDTSVPATFVTNATLEVLSCMDDIKQIISLCYKEGK